MCPSVHVKVTFVFYFFHHMGLGKEVSLPDDMTSCWLSSVIFEADLELPV